MPDPAPEEIARKVVDACADCDICRYLMDANCLLFPELYRLYDRETESGEKITARELRNLVDLCNFCALCPCPNIRADVIKAKTGFVDTEGVGFKIRALEDVQRIGKLCGASPAVANRVLKADLTGGLLKACIGIHDRRKIPEFPRQSFDRWMKARPSRPAQTTRRKVVYFAGCTGRFLFPDVPKAVVEVLEHNGVEVAYPQQQCCGMPSMLEGDRRLTLKFAGSNLEQLIDAVEKGYDILCSCSTCGYFFKTVLKGEAAYSREYQRLVGARKDQIKIPLDNRPDDPDETKFLTVKKSIYHRILKDDGYFSSLDPQQRLRTAEKIFDVGEYLLKLHREKLFDTGFGPLPAEVAYYPPCHLREQGIGQPYLELLRLIPGVTIQAVDWSLYCCGMAGIMGFKKDFHHESLELGRPLMDKIREVDPDLLATDCLSCRVQFNQVLDLPVSHPIEILRRGYRAGQEKTGVAG